MTPLTATLIATIGVSLLSLSGLLVTTMRVWTEALELRLLSFAAGVLIATGLISLLPEAVAIAGAGPALQACLAAVVGFYVLDRWLERGRAVDHHHHVRPGHASNARSLILIGDALHNFVDGVVIAVAFMIDPAVGWMTALSVAAHELPHEIGDYAILVRGGFSPARAAAFNLLSGLTAVLGGLVAFARWPLVETDFGSRPFVEANLGLFVAVAAGMFLYIAMVNLIPEVQHAGRGRHDLQTIPFLAGIALILVLGWFLPHAGHRHSAAPGGLWDRTEGVAMRLIPVPAEGALFVWDANGGRLIAEGVFDTSLKRSIETTPGSHLHQQPEQRIAAMPARTASVPSGEGGHHVESLFHRQLDHLLSGRDHRE